MGMYVNPVKETKEYFLKKNGIMIESNVNNLTMETKPIEYKWSDVPEGYLPVVLVDNGSFTAAGIGYCEKEYKAFTKYSESRPAVVFIVENIKLEEFMD